MSGEFQKCACPHCQGPVEFPLALTGTLVACPHCGEEMPLIGPEAAEDQVPQPVLTASVLATSINGKVRRRLPPWRYQVALAAATITMILLPLAYLALIAALLWGIVSFAFGFFPWWAGWIGRPGYTPVNVTIYLGGLALGLVVVAFLIKPLFAPKPRRAPPLALNAAAEPLLFAFVHMICDTVGAPYPSRVDVDCRLNASAGFGGGAWSLLTGRMVLTVGLPLVANLNLRQFAGVLAHEFGHFNQRFGLRASSLVRSVNLWLNRMACGRDGWDEALDAWALGSEGARTHFFASTARLGIQFSRALLRVFMYAGQAVSCSLLRQMEYDADRCQIEVAGSEEFERTFRRLQSVRGVSMDVYRQLRAAWNLNRRMPANLPERIRSAEAMLSPEQRERLLKACGHHETDWFSTHPSDESRLERAREMNAPGLLDLEVATSQLFSNFEVLARQVTLLHYEDDLGLPREAIQLVPNSMHASG